MTTDTTPAAHEPRDETGQLEGAMKIAIVGDYRPDNETHRAVTDGLTLARADVEWVPSNEVDSRAERLVRYGGVVAAPGSPYVSMEGVLAAIRHARERGVPFTGT